MPSGTGEGTEAYTWNTETEWNNGTFSNTTTDGSGNLVLAERNTDLSFSYDISITTGASTDDATVRVLDQNNNVLAEAEVTGNSSDTGTLTVTAANAGVLTLQASGEANDGTGTSDASISDNFGHTVSISTSGAFTISEETYDYTYPESGTWTSAAYDFSEVTTATKLVNTSSQPSPTSITGTVETSGGSTTSVSLAAGTDVSVLFEIGASTQYTLTVELTTDIVDDTTPTPSLESVTLETHTPPTGLSVTDTRETAVDFSWNSISVSDGYEIYYSTSSGVTASDTLGFDTTTAGDAAGTVTGLDEGTDYYFNIRAQYSGE